MQRSTTAKHKDPDAWARSILHRYRALKCEATKLAAVLCPATACRSCGGKDRLQRHHINGKRLDNRRANLTVLCHACHNGMHYRERREAPRTQTPLASVWVVNEALGLSDVHVRA